MKKLKKIFVAATLCATVAVGYNAYQQATMTEEERLMLANIEALATGDESGIYVKTITWTDITSIDDEGNVSIVKRKDCEAEGTLIC